MQKSVTDHNMQGYRATKDVGVGAGPRSTIKGELHMLYYLQIFFLLYMIQHKDGVTKSQTKFEKFFAAF